MGVRLPGANASDGPAWSQESGFAVRRLLLVWVSYRCLVSTRRGEHLGCPAAGGAGGARRHRRRAAATIARTP